MSRFVPFLKHLKVKSNVSRSILIRKKKFRDVLCGTQMIIQWFFKVMSMVQVI